MNGTVFLSSLIKLMFKNNGNHCFVLGIKQVPPQGLGISKQMGDLKTVVGPFLFYKTFF